MSSRTFKSFKITDRVHWVGAIDWALREFHGYRTGRGTTYNAFLVLGERVVLVDTVKKPFYDEMMSRIASVVDPTSISVIVSNHAELDHSGGLPQAVRDLNPERVIASTAGVAALGRHFQLGVPVQGVKDGEVASIGDTRLAFTETKMLHWPESMFTFAEDEGVLFSQDVFGMHLASTERYVDELDPHVVEYEAAKYYANIIMPYSTTVAKLLAKVVGLLPKVRVLATDHGPMWRTPADVGRIASLYARWAEQAPTRKAVVVFDTMWGSTDSMARAIAEGLAAGGARVRFMPLSSSDRSDVATELLDAGALLVGSPNLNGRMYPTVADVLTYLRGLRPRNLIGAAFGSYGWSGGVVEQVQAVLDEMKVEAVAEPVAAKYVPDQDDLIRCRALGERVASRLAELVG